METMPPGTESHPLDKAHEFDFEPFVVEPPPPAPPPPSTGRPRPPHRWRRSVTAAVVAVVFMGGVALGSFIAPEESAPAGTALPTTTLAQPDTAGTPAPTPAPQLGTVPPPTASDEPVAFAAAVLKPAIVQIDTRSGLGSGFIYDESGLILTAAHVVSGSADVLVTFADGSKVDGVVVGEDSLRDVAVVSVDVDGPLPVAELALDDELVPGQMAVAIGSPFGLEQTITAGIVSNVARPVVGRDGTVRDLIQTDASINRGNSGGPLADRRGHVIGINDLIFSQSGGSEGVGFAIPIGYAKKIADQLVAGEVVETVRLGVSGADPDRGTAGALITAVEPGSPASVAGIEVGDLIVALDGEPVQSFVDLAAAIRSRLPGDTVEISLLRDGVELTVPTVLTAR